MTSQLLEEYTDGNSQIPDEGFIADIAGIIYIGEVVFFPGHVIQLSLYISYFTGAADTVRGPSMLLKGLPNVSQTVSILQSFILAMVLNPEVQRRAQEELHRVVGSERLPTFEDRQNLVYVEAIYKECLRYVEGPIHIILYFIIELLPYSWQPVLPIGVPHLVTVDDTYKGYFIPAGTIVVANEWLAIEDVAILSFANMLL